MRGLMSPQPRANSTPTSYERLDTLLAITQVVAGFHVEVKHIALYPIAKGTLGTE